MGADLSEERHGASAMPGPADAAQGDGRIEAEGDILCDR
jgi:hypothetical protein